MCSKILELFTHIEVIRRDALCDAVSEGVELVLAEMKDTFIFLRTLRPSNMCIVDEVILRVVGCADCDEQVAVR